VKRRALTPDEREQRRQWMRHAWADDRFANRKQGLHPRHWTPEQDQALAVLAGTMPIDEIAAELECRFYLARTRPAIRIRAKRLGISLWQHGYSLQAMTRAFGVDHRVIKRFWVTPGHLQGRRWKGRGPNDGWWFERADVEQFVSACGWLYPHERMRPGHPLTRLAEVAHRADPWIVGLDALCRILKLAPVNVKKWIGRGLIPHRRRPGAGGLGEIVVRGRDVPAILNAIASAQHMARQTSTTKFTAYRQASSELARHATLQHCDRVAGACRNGHVRTLENTRISAAQRIACLDCRADRIALGRAG
jgi:hypothetical protein